MDVTIIVATFGGDEWLAIANRHGMASALRFRNEASVIRHHGDDLMSARNDAAAKAKTEWLCFLDADDELAPGYFGAMAQASGDLRAPALSFVTDKTATEPVTLDDRDIINGMNPCCIGTLIRREMFLDVGGFWDEPAFEDWSLFRRAALIGATIEHVPGAIYRAQVRPKSRNRSVQSAGMLCQRIISTHNVWLRERGQQAS